MDKETKLPRPPKEPRQLNRPSHERVIENLEKCPVCSRPAKRVSRRFHMPVTSGAIDLSTEGRALHLGAREAR